MAVRPAATVILLRDGPAGPETFMVRRHPASFFMAGAHVFPGGRVDAADSGATAEWCDGLDIASKQLSGLSSGDALAHAVAAARELFEEAGVLLVRDTAAPPTVSAAGPATARPAPGAGAADVRHPPLGDPDRLAPLAEHRADVHSGRRTFRDVVMSEQLRLALDLLVPFAHWVTPPGDTRRFDTRFFAAQIPPRQAASHDGAEATESAWMTPRDAIAAATAREILLPLPTWATLRELQPFASVGDVLAWARSRTIEARQPDTVEDAGRSLLILPGGRPNLPGTTPFETRFVWTGDRWRPEGMA